MSRDELAVNNGQHSSSLKQTSTNVRDPFVLETHSTTSRCPIMPLSTNNWQSYVQQQYQHTFGSRSSCSTSSNSSSITRAHPILSSIEQQYSSTESMNPSHSSASRSKEKKISTSNFFSFFGFSFLDEQRSPFDHSPKGKISRKTQQVRFYVKFCHCYKKITRSY